jgi:hypothetical protein
MLQGGVGWDEVWGGLRCGYLKCEEEVTWLPGAGTGWVRAIARIAHGRRRKHRRVTLSIRGLESLP